MPELPEVETIKRQLEKEIVGKKIIAVDVRLPKIVKYPVKKFKSILTDATIKGVERRAKLIIINVGAIHESSLQSSLSEKTSEYSLLIHLKMTGQLIYINSHSERSEESPAYAGFHSPFVKGSTPKKGGISARIRERSFGLRPQDDKRGEINKHTRLIYNFSDKSRLVFNDLRQFGYVKLLPAKDLADFFKKEKYGPEPLEKSFILKQFKELLLKRKNVKIKPILMDQRFIAGIGNLYADEILFRAGVLPARLVKSLKETEIKKLFDSIKKILKLAVNRHGSSIENYVDAYGKKGGFAPLIKVYGREGEKCFRCGEIIRRAKIGGRSAHWCAKCQG